jgi:sirohydrochlorin ferrochelatase
MATDGQGVVLAVPQSVDSRQRTALDLLARRVSHRMGRPVVIGHVRQATLLGGAPLKSLHGRGVREVVVVPLSIGRLRLSPEIELGGPETAALARSMSVALSEPLGGDPAIIEGVQEMLARSERAADPGTTLELVLSGLDASAAEALRGPLPDLRADGWADARLHVLGTDGPGAADGPARVTSGRTPRGDARLLVVGLAITPGQFLDRVAQHARQSGGHLLPATLHSTEALSRAICERISSARRH